MKLKNFLIAALMISTVICGACWFNQDNFNGNYIAFLTGDVIHYSPTGLISDSVYYNGQTVEMPFTVFVKIGDRFDDNDSKVSIKRAVLQYKILPDGEWITVKDINNVSWELDFQNPVALFGRNSINIPNITANTEILIRVYLTDGIYETGNLDVDISEDNVLDTARGSNSTEVNYEGGWTAPFVMKVKISGEERPTR